jgi:hypothetical protein
MSDLNVVARVSRTLLGQGDLDINDHTSYALAGPSIFQGQVQWQRNSSGAPWVDGEITWERHRTNSTEPLTVYAKGSSLSDLDSKIATLHAAFFQDRYTLQVIVGGANHAWDCETADVSAVQYDTAHVASLYVAITYSIPRKPIPLAGGF